MRGSYYRRCSCSKVNGKSSCGGRCREGRWYFRIWLPGGRRLHRGGFSSKREAEEAAAEAYAQAGVASSGRQTVTDWFDGWNKDRLDIRPTTRNQNQMVIDRYIKPAIGHLRLDDVQHEHIEAMYKKAMDRGARGRPLHPASVRRIHAVTRAGFAQAVRRRKLQYNPAEYVQLPEVVRTRPKVWTFEELDDALKLLAKDPMYALWSTAAFTGMRRGELLGLRWDHVDLDDHSIRVEITRVKVSHDLVEGPTKSESGRRTIYIDVELVELLRAHKERQQMRAQDLDLAWEESCHVFTNDALEPLHPERVTKAWRRTQADCGIPRSIKLHELRHTHLSQFQAANANIKTTSARAGHANAYFTADTYTQVLADEARSAAQAVRGKMRRPGD